MKTSKTIQKKVDTSCRIEKGLHERVKSYCFLEKVSMNYVIEQALEMYLKADVKQLQEATS